MLKKPIQKEKRNVFHNFMKDKTEQAQLKKSEQLKKILLNPNKDNQFKDLRTAKTKLHNVTISKSFKKRKFDLNSEDEDEKIPDVLQHKGQPLEMVDDFNEDIERSSNDEEDLNKEYVNELHFGGFEDSNNNDPSQIRKSKQEIYKEIIKKSKKMRYEKQKLREENISKVEEIDQNEETLHKILEMKLSKEERKAQKTQEDDDYDKLTKEFLMDEKTYASNVSLNDHKKKKDENKNKNKRMRKKEKIFSDDEEDEDEEDDTDMKNDDELEENLKTEKRGIGYDFDSKQRKTAKLHAFLTQLQEIKKKKMGNDALNSSNSEEDLEPSNEEDDSELEGEEEGLEEDDE